MGTPRALILPDYAHGVVTFVTQMGRSISHQDQIFSAIDAYFDAERNMTEAKRSLAKAFITWLESQTVERAGAEIAATLAQSEPLMTADELGDYLKLEPQTLRQWARDGRIPCVYANSEIRFRRPVIDKWLDEGQRDKIEKSSPTQDDTVVKSSRSFLRPQRSRSKSNGRL